jgi:hypothetical protein
MTDINDNDSSIIDKKLLYINDNNNGSYNGQITYNLQSLANTNNFLNFQEAYLEIPFVISMKVDGDLFQDADEGATMDKNIMKMVTIKDNFIQIIDNIQLSVSGRIIHQEHKFNNVHSYYKLLMTCSKDFIDKNNSNYGMYVDTIDQKEYQASGDQYYCPSEYFSNSNSSSVERRNRELLHSERLNYGYVPNNREIQAMGIDGAKLTGCSFYERVGDKATTSTATYYWVYFCTIPLRDFADYFKQCPLTRSSDMQLVVTYNSTNVTFLSRTIEATTAPTYSSTIPLANTSIQQISGNTCPYTITINEPIKPIAANLPATGATANVTFTILSNIGGTTHGRPTGMAFNNTRLYVPSYKLSPERSLELSQIPQNIVEYNDIFTFSIIDKQPNEIVREVVSTGIVNAQYIMIIPFYAKNTNRNPEWQNCFDTAPATSSNIALEFQIELAGENIFKADIIHNFSMYNDQIASIFALNKNIDPQRSSGVLTKYLWENSHRCYLADLSRRNRSEDLVAKSITLSCKNLGTNDSGRVSLLIFVGYKRSVKLNGATGLIED